MYVCIDLAQRNLHHKTAATAGVLNAVKANHPDPSLRSNQVPSSHTCVPLDQHTLLVFFAITSDEVCNQGLSDGERVCPLHFLLMGYTSDGGQYLTLHL